MIPLCIICIYLALLLGLGLFSNRFFRGTSSDYMLASHSIGPFLLVMSLFGTTMTAFAIVGSTGKSYKLGVGVFGLLASSTGIVHSLLFFFIGLKLWSLARRHGYTTQIQFFRHRLESNAFGLLLFPVLVGLVIPYLLIGVIASGGVINSITAGAFESWGWFPESGYGTPKWMASLGICLVVLTYVFFGGMRGTAWANAVQTIVFLVLGLVTFLVIAKGVGGQDGLLASMRAASQAVDKEHLSPAKIPKLEFLAYLLIPASVAMFPHVFQHWLTARSAATFKVPIVAQPLLIMALWIPTVLIGTWASGYLPDGTSGKDVLALMVSNLAGPVLGGLITAGILAAIMSSLDSQFLCIGSIFTNDIILHYFRKEGVSERQKVIWARSFVVCIVTITYLISLCNPAGVFQMGIWCFSGFTGLVPLVVAALYWRRLTLAGATASVLTVIVTWCVLFYRADFGKNTLYAFPESPVVLGDIVLIPSLMPIVPITFFAAIALVAVSLVTKPPSKETLAKFFDLKDGTDCPQRLSGA